jgi:hypothetical protein
MDIFLKILPYIISISGILIVIGLYRGKLEDVVEKCKDLPQWRSNVDVRLTLCEENDKNQSEILAKINENLIKISTTVNLLVDDRIKKNGDK